MNALSGKPGNKLTRKKCQVKQNDKEEKIKSINKTKNIRR